MIEQTTDIIRASDGKAPADLIDAAEYRRTAAFRRRTYTMMLLIAVGLLAAMPFVNIAAAGVFGTVAMMIVCGSMLNARDREPDLQGLLQVIQEILGKR
jgi:hypothetical protein